MVIGMQVSANLTDKVIGGNYNDLLKTIIGASCSNHRTSAFDLRCRMSSVFTSPSQTDFCSRAVWRFQKTSEELLKLIRLQRVTKGFRFTIRMKSSTAASLRWSGCPTKISPRAHCRILKQSTENSRVIAKYLQGSHTLDNSCVPEPTRGKTLKIAAHRRFIDNEKCNEMKKTNKKTLLHILCQIWIRVNFMHVHITCTFLKNTNTFSFVSAKRF